MHANYCADGASFAGEGGFFSEGGQHGLFGGRVVWVADVADVWTQRAFGDDFTVGAAFFDEVRHDLHYMRRVLVRYKAHTYFGFGCVGNDRFNARSAVTADDTMHFEGR